MAQITFTDKDKVQKHIDLCRINLIYGANGAGKTTMLKTITSENIVACSQANEAKIIWELRTTLAEKLPSVKKSLLGYLEKDKEDDSLLTLPSEIINQYEVGNENLSDGQKQLHDFIQSLIYGMCKYGDKGFTLVVDNFLSLVAWHTHYQFMLPIIDLLYDFDICLVAATPSIDVVKLFKEVILFCPNYQTLNIQETFKYLNIPYLDRYGAYVIENGSFQVLGQKFSDLP